MIRHIQLAVVQSPGTPGRKHLEVVETLVMQAASKGAQLVLLPELFANPFDFDSTAWHEATPQGGAIEQFLCASAQSHGIYLGGSYLEAKGKDFFYTFALASPAGRIVGRVGKANPCSLERCVFAPAIDTPVIETELGRIGVAICYDNTRRDTVDRLLAANPDIWLMPMSAPLLPYSLAGNSGKARYLNELRDSPAALAMHFGIPVAMANKYGEWKPRMPGWFPCVASHFPGASCIADSDGSLLARADDEVGYAFARVCLDDERKRLRVAPEFDAHRPWLSKPLPDYRLFPFYEWWAERHYRRHPQRATLAQKRSHADV